MLQPENFTIQNYLGREFPCSCGRTHATALREVLVKAGAAAELPALLARGGWRKAFVVFDENTRAAAGGVVLGALEQGGCAHTAYTLRAQGLLPDETGLGALLMHFDRACDVILAVGSGTINDLCRFLSYQLGMEYIIFGTAPSMDGFASGVAAMITENAKTTYETHVPAAIVGDLNVLCAAPLPMLAAGVGDILGKYTCLCDWRLAHLVTGEYFCPVLAQMVEHSVQTIIDALPLVESRSEAAVAAIMEGLVLSGIAMSFAGNSRPASGSEHHLSHYWEMMFLFDGKPAVLHGTKVGVGTVATLRGYELLCARPVDFAAARAKAQAYRQAEWEAKMRGIYRLAAPQVIALERRAHKNSPDEVLRRINSEEAHWDEIYALARGTLPAANALAAMLESLGAPSTPAELGIDAPLVHNAVVAAKEVRCRFGLLQLLYDLGLSEEIADDLNIYFSEKQG